MELMLIQTAYLSRTQYGKPGVNDFHLEWSGEAFGSGLSKQLMHSQRPQVVFFANVPLITT